MLRRLLEMLFDLVQRIMALIQQWVQATNRMLVLAVNFIDLHIRRLG